jgi:hypothetical protein
VVDTALVSRLHEVVTALDSRVRHPERPGEKAIARDSAVIRAQAVAQLDELAQPADAAFEARWTAWKAAGRADDLVVSRRWRHLGGAVVVAVAAAVAAQLMR